MASKKQQQRQKVLTIALAVMVTFSLAGLTGIGVGSHGGGADVSQGGHEAPPQSFGRVVCSTGDAFQIRARFAIIADGEEETFPAGLGITPECPLEIQTEDASGTVLISSDVDKGYTWTDFFEFLGINPHNTTGYILAGVIVDGVDNPGQDFNFNTPIVDGQEFVLDYISLPPTQ